VVGIENYENFENDISVFPNPANDYFQINSSGEKINSVEIYSVSGQLVKVIDIENPETTVLVTVGTELEAGFYQMILRAGDNSISKKLMIVR
jgi:hypothetical protein